MISRTVYLAKSISNDVAIKAYPQKQEKASSGEHARSKEINEINELIDDRVVAKKLDENLKVSRETIATVRSNLRLGSNALKDWKLHDVKMAFLAVSKMEETLDRAKKQLGYDLNPIQEGRLRLDMMKLYGYGRCTEQAKSAFYLLSLGSQRPLRLCTTSEGTHCFVVIGEGKSAVVCDPWADKTYPLDQFAEMQKPENDVPEAAEIVQERQKALAGTGYLLPPVPPHYLAGDFQEVWSLDQ